METERQGRKGVGRPWEYLGYSDIDPLEYPEMAPDDPDSTYLYGPEPELESSFMV